MKASVFSKSSSSRADPGECKSNALPVWCSLYPGRARTLNISFSDIFPTILDIAENKILKRKSLDGGSFKKLLFNKSEKVLIIDDLIATGGTAEAAAKLIEMSGGSIAGFIFVINLFDLPGKEMLEKKSYTVKSIIEFPGH